MQKQKTQAFKSGNHQINHFGITLTHEKEWIENIKKHNIEVMYGGQIEHKYSTSWYVVDPTGHEIEVSHWKNNNIKFDS